MKKNVGNVCVTVALVCLALVVVFAWLAVWKTVRRCWRCPWRQAPGSWWPSTV